MEPGALLLFREMHNPTVRIFMLQDPAAPDEEEPVGVAVTHQMPGTTLVALRVVFVAPSQRHQGAGRRLVGALADRCRAEGLRRVQACSDDRTMTAFLLACGFQPGADGLVFDL
jgi:N-acetylglutamate synthase-like GNAT family acetyltransferase